MILSGFYAGRIGFKRSIVFSFAVLGCACLSIPCIKSFSAFYIIVFVVGFSSGIFLPAVMPLIREHFSGEILGRTISMYDSAGAISIFSVPFIALLLLKYFQWRGIFSILGGVLLIIAMLFFLKGEELKVNHPHATVFRCLVTKKSLWVMVSLMSAMMGANLGIYYILPLYLTKELFLSIGYANTLLGISRLGGVGIAILCGFLVDRFSLRIITFVMIIVSGVLTIILGMSPTTLTGITLFLQALFISGIPPLLWVCMARLFDRETLSMAVGFIMPLSIMFGTGLIPYLLGLSGDLLSFRFGIIMLGVLLTVVSWLTLSLRELEPSS
jgi:MFS family permease